MGRYPALGLGVVLALVVCAFADEKPERKKPVAIGQKVGDFELTDDDGRAFQLFRSAGRFGGAAKTTLSTRIADLPGVKEDDELDTYLVAELACNVGRHFGMLATEETVAAFQTLADLADWIEAGVAGPLVFYIHSPRCPVVRRAHDHIVEVMARLRVRTYALASHYDERPEHHAAFRDAFDFVPRVFPDPEQHVVDRLGGVRTTQAFLIDRRGVLRYRGAIDNDLMGFLDESERKTWLADAVEALRKGIEIPVKETKPSG